MSGTPITLEDREKISRGLAEEETFTAITERLGRAASTVCREVARNGGSGRYRAYAAQRATRWRRRRPKPRKLGHQWWLRTEVEARLRLKHSPEQIANRLEEDFPADEGMRISHEAIYQELYLQGRGSLRAEFGSGSGRNGPKHLPLGDATSTLGPDHVLPGPPDGARRRGRAVHHRRRGTAALPVHARGW